MDKRELKYKAFTVVIHILLFWVVADLFSGIELKEGVAGYLICGTLFGLVMLAVVPLIRFFTLPIKFITLFLISIMLSVMIYFVLNFGIPYIDFSDGEIVGFQNSFFQLPVITLSMIGNVFVGGLIAGTLSACINYLGDLE